MPVDLSGYAKFASGNGPSKQLAQQIVDYCVEVKKLRLLSPEECKNAIHFEPKAVAIETVMVRGDVPNVMLSVYGRPEMHSLRGDFSDVEFRAGIPSYTRINIRSADTLPKALNLIDLAVRSREERLYQRQHR